MIKKRITFLSLSLFTPLFIGVVLLAAFTATIAHTAPDSTITVSNLNDNGAGSLRQAINDAKDGDMINFSTSGFILLSSELVVTKSVTISSSVPITISGNNAVRVFNVMTNTLSPQVSVTFDSLTIANGNVQTEDCGEFLEFCGSGIILQNGGVAVTVTNSIIISNSASVGSGIFNANGTLIVINSTLSNNSATDSGGGIFNSDGMVTVMNSTFSDNTAVTGNGGGINVSSAGNMMISHSTLSGNEAASTGGGIKNNGTLTLTNSTFSGNSSNYGGGIMNANHPDGLFTINTSTISGNSAKNGGGGIYTSQGTMVINNSTVTDNRVNAGQDGGSGIGAYGYSDTDTALTNTIVSGNTISGTTTADDLKLVDGDIDSFSSGGNNLIGAIGPDIDAFTNGVNGDHTDVNDPMLGPLTDNGGSSTGSGQATLTHALLAGSPALDAGSANCGSTDQRGLTRPQNGICDIGAFEKQVFFVFLPVIVKN